MVAKRLPAPDLALDFQAWMELAKERHVDPYTIWSLQTKFRQFKFGDQMPEVLDFLIELDNPLGQGVPTWPEMPGRRQPEVPGIYKEPMPGSEMTARHITLRVPMKYKRLQEVADAVLRLVALKGVKRAQIGFPRPAGTMSGDPNTGGTVLPRWDPAAAPKVLLGVLEDGCPFGHPALAQSENQTRVVAIWDQSASPYDGSDLPPPGLGYGRQRVQKSLNKLLTKHADPGGVDEQALYLDPQALQHRLPLRSSHAAAVITLLAGDLTRLPSHPSADDTAMPIVTAPRQKREIPNHDPAARAPLVVVQFPSEQIYIAGARWMMVRALDGLRYLARASTQVGGSAEAPLPLVVNLSYGSMVGAHDGTGLLETAMAELAKAHEKMAIVLAAGNAYGTGRAIDTTDDLARVPSGRHAEHQALEPGAVTLLRLYIPPNKAFETYLEIWFEDTAVEHCRDQFLEPQDVSIRVTTPTGQTLAVDKFPGVDFDTDSPATTGAGLLCFPRVAQSRRRSMALLVVAATRMSVTGVAVPSGIWSVQVENEGRRTLRVLAWVERDLAPGAARQAARLLDSQEPHFAKLYDTNTLSNIATGDEVFRVGALTALGDAGQLGVSPYSSAAAEGRPGPELSAIADDSPQQPGIRVSGNHSGAVLRINGTSVAAPQAARWIARRLAGGVSMAKIREEIAGSRGDGRLGRIKV